MEELSIQYQKGTASLYTLTLQKHPLMKCILLQALSQLRKAKYVCFSSSWFGFVDAPLSASFTAELVCISIQRLVGSKPEGLKSYQPSPHSSLCRECISSRCSDRMGCGMKGKKTGLMYGKSLSLLSSNIHRALQLSHRRYLKYSYQYTFYLCQYER